MKAVQRNWGSIIRFEGLAYRLDYDSLSPAGKVFSKRIAFVRPWAGETGSKQRLLIYSDPRCTEFLGHADAYR